MRNAVINKQERNYSIYGYKPIESSENKSENHIYFAPFKTKKKKLGTQLTSVCFLHVGMKKWKEINKKGNK